MGDPSRLWGYVALTDPQTGEHHLLYDLDNPSQVNGYPDRLLITFLEAPDLLPREVVINQPCRPITFAPSDRSPASGSPAATTTASHSARRARGRASAAARTAGGGVRRACGGLQPWDVVPLRTPPRPLHVQGPDPRWDVPGAVVKTYGPRRGGELALQPCDPFPWQPLYADEA